MDTKMELDYFCIGTAYGGSQAWFTDRFMKIGGCAAAAACDSCIFLERSHGIDGLYPYAADNLTREDYVKFSLCMKPYLHPRLFGINRLDTYIRGFGKYLKERDCNRIRMEAFEGNRESREAREVIEKQIRSSLPVPFLLLFHKNPEFKNYVWHWFMITGFLRQKERFYVKAATYGGWKWLDLDALWDTGHRRRGGMILYTTPGKTT